MSARRRRPRPAAEPDTEALESLALALASGILLAAPFLWPVLSWLHYVALVPWCVLLAAPERRRSWLYLLLGAYLSYAMAFGPFSALHKVVPFWSALVLAPWMIVFALVARSGAVRLRLPLALVVPVAWVAAEWIRLRLSIGQVGLFPLGSSQYRLTPLIQIADLTGLAGVSFVVAAVNGAIADLWRARSRPRRALLAAAAVLVAVVAVLAYGLYRLRTLGPLREGPRIAVVQPNEVHYRDPARTREVFDRQLDLVREGIAPGAADLIALPENTVDYPFSEDPYYESELRKLARELRSAVLAGAFSWASKQDGTLYTSGYYFSPAGELLGRYDKLYLIPWAEYLPFAGWLGRLAPGLNRLHSRLAGKALRFEPAGVGGEALTIFALEAGGSSYGLAAPICYEVANAVFARRAAAAGAVLLVNISSEGFFGAPLYHHMWAQSTLRAVETRLPVVRAGNNGVSGFIDPLGRAQSVVEGQETGRPYLDRGTLIDRPAMLERPGSFYARRGDLFALLCVGAAMIFLGAAWKRGAAERA